MTDITYVQQLRRTISGEFYFGAMCRETKRRIVVNGSATQFSSAKQAEAWLRTSKGHAVPPERLAALVRRLGADRTESWTAVCLFSYEGTAR
jgi:hypothetical protein